MTNDVVLLDDKKYIKCFEKHLLMIWGDCLPDIKYNNVNGKLKITALGVDVILDIYLMHKNSVDMDDVMQKAAVDMTSMWKKIISSSEKIQESNFNQNQFPDIDASYIGGENGGSSIMVSHSKSFIGAHPTFHFTTDIFECKNFMDRIKNAISYLSFKRGKRITVNLNDKQMLDVLKSLTLIYKTAMKK